MHECNKQLEVEDVSPYSEEEEGCVQFQWRLLL